ncbi:stage II sporulation protein M [Candidatus Nitrosotenuis sp. DW1]|nr:stage II sporulation protein M [Candidatus Nitrosotenuis sp. DW1]
MFFFVFLAVFSTAFSLGAEMDVSEEDASIFLDEFNKLLDSLKGENFGLEIFLHNVEIALPMFIPGFGIVWGIFSAFSTGFAFAAIATTNSLLEKIPPITMIFTTPFGLMELAAYSIGMSRSFLLIVGILKKRSVLQQWKQTVLEIGIVIGLLLLGGIVEAYMIETLAGPNVTLPKVN